MTFDEDGVIHERAEPEGDNALRVARSELAAFKFRMFETVAADPRLAKAPCLNVLAVFMSFVTIDKRTLKPTTAYASMITIMVRGGVKEASARLARKLLEKNGYLVATGSKTKDGCTKYRIVNPHVERVAMHVEEATEYLRDQVAFKRAEERRKNLIKAAVGSPHAPTENACGFATRSDVGSPHAPNYLRGNLSSLGTEKEQPIKVSSTSQVNSYQSAKDGGDPHEPFPIPDDEEQAMDMLKEITAGTSFIPAIFGFFRKALIEGTLTPAMVEDARRLAA